jgi:hypothetical protein
MQHITTEFSVANWPKFWPQNTEVAPEKFQQPEETAAEFLQIVQKMAEKWPNFFAVYSSHKSLDYLLK